MSLAYVLGQPNTTSGNHYLVGAGNVKVKLNGTVVSSNQFNYGGFSNTQPLHTNLCFGTTLSTSTQTWTVEFTNGRSVAFNAYAILVVFTVADLAFLDTTSVALTNGSQVTVGNLSTSLQGDVAVIAIASAENTSNSNVTAFNANDVVLQLNNSATGQISNLVGWRLEASASHGRSGNLPLFRFDTRVTNPSYQVKMTARANGINGEAKIVAFIVSFTVTIRYSVAPGGNPVQGQILLRYTHGGVLRRLVLSTSHQTVPVDPNTEINADFVSSGSTAVERWAYRTGGNFTATITGPAYFNLLYYNQIRVSLVPNTALPRTEPTSGTNRATVTARTFGASAPYHVWENATSPTIWVDRGGNLAWSQTTTGSTATHRWATPGSVTLENVQAPSTSTATYYEQWLVTWAVQLATGSTPLSSTNYAWARGTQFAGALTLSPLVTSVTDWVDHFSLIWIDTPTSGSDSTRRWINYFTTYNVSTSGTYYFPVQEEVLTRILVVDPDGATILGAQEITVKQHNGSVIVLPLDSALSPPVMIQANVQHNLTNMLWRGLATGGAAPGAGFTPRLANGTAPLVYPRIWANLGGSGGEIFLKSSSEVTSVIWDRGRGVLYIQSDKARGETFFYYGFAGKAPRYVYIDGTLFSDVGYEVDHPRQLIRLSVGGGSFLFDFEGKTQPPPQPDLQTLVQQLYTALSQLVIQQPTAPPVTVPSIDLGFLARLVAAIAAAIDSVSPVPSAIILPGAFLLATFLLIYSGLRRLRRGGPAGEYPREVVVVREPGYRAGFARWAAYTLASTAILAPLLYYVLPRLFPRFFEAPAVDFRIFLFAILAATALALVFTALILGAGRPSRGVLRRRNGG